MGLRMAMWNLFGGQNRDGNLFLAWLSEECFEHDATWAPGCDDQEHAYNEGKRSIILKMRRSLMLAEEMAHGRRSDPDE